MKLGKLPLLVVAAILNSASGAPAATTPDSFAAARAVIAQAQAIPAGGIDEMRTVELGGLKQWIHVRGRNRANPIILFLHGGPGSPMMPESWTWQQPWEDFFTMVQWDQRGAGKTFASAGSKPDPNMTIAQMQGDTEQLIAWLCHNYGQKKIFLIGHSWGSILGLRVAQSRPDLLYAYIGVGQVVNGRDNEAVGYRETLARAKATGNQEAIKSLQALAPYPGPNGQLSMEKVVVERKWDVALGGMLYGKSTDAASEIWRLSPDYSDADYAAAQAGELSSVQILLPQLAQVNFDSVTRFKCPVFIFAGADDRTTPETLAEQYFQHIDAPEKKFFKIDRAAHYVMTEAQGVMLLDMVKYVRPLAQPGLGTP
jgi:pimeloyl-ACP methyl ester carboxylesterase